MSIPILQTTFDNHLSLDKISTIDEFVDSTFGFIAYE